MVAVVATVVQAVLYFIRQWQERLTLVSALSPGNLQYDFAFGVQ